MENLVLFGGSFDPIHKGHLRIARAASMMLNADVVFVPAKNPPWKKPKASAEARLAMLRLALKGDGSSSFSISLREMKSKDPVNYWIDTLEYFQARYPRVHLYFLIGADEVNAFPKWKDAKRCAEIATPLYCARKGVKIDDEVLKEFRMQRLPYEKAGLVSSSEIRTLQNMDLPISVRDYIERKQLYYFEPLRALVSKARLAHSLSVARLSYEMARRNGMMDAERAYIAGLLHDIGKGIPKEEARKKMEENHADALDMPAWTYHQYLGADLAKEIFAIKDDGVLDAIRYHASGKPGMSALGKIVYSADKTDPLRGYDSSKLISACMKNTQLGFVTVLQANRDYFTEKGWTIDNPLTKECMKVYLGAKDI